MAESRPGVILYFETLQAIEELDAEDAKQMVSAILHYSRDGVLPDFHGTLAAFWLLIRPSLDRDGERYNTQRLRGIWLTYCRKCKKEGNAPLDFEEWAAKRAVNDTLTENNDTMPCVERTVDVSSPTTSSAASSSTASSSTKRESIGADKPPTPARRRFVPPTLEEVTEYVKQRGSKVDPQGFIDFYASKGWMVGNNKMIDWKAACRRAEKWERWDKRPLDSSHDKVKTAADYDGGESFV